MLRNTRSAWKIAVGILWTASACAGAFATDASPVTNVLFAALDIETTGLNSRRGAVVEMAVVRFRDNRVLDTNVWLVHPPDHIPAAERKAAEAVHGITPDMLRDAPEFAQVYPRVLETLQGAVVIAHNAPFDMRFLQAEVDRAGLAAPTNTVLDTLRLLRGWFPDLPHHGLQDLAAYLEVETNTQHRASADALCLVQVFLRALARREPGMDLQRLVVAAGGELHFTAPVPPTSQSALR